MMDATRLVERLAASPMGQKFLEEERAEILQRRKELAAEIQRLTAEFEVALPPLHQTVEKAEAKVQRAQEALKAAQETHGQAVNARTHLCNSHDMRRSKLEGELCTTASPAIRAFVGEMRNLFDSLRRVQFHGREPRRDVRGNVIADDGPDPYQQQAKRMRAVQEAMREAEGLMLEALTEDELAEKLEALRASTSAN